MVKNCRVEPRHQCFHHSSFSSVDGLGEKVGRTGEDASQRRERGNVVEGGGFEQHAGPGGTPPALVKAGRSPIAPSYCQRMVATFRHAFARRPTSTFDPQDILNLFYEDDEFLDRWIILDRYPRSLVRRIFRGPGRIGGHQRVFLNLIAGLDRIGVRYRVNDYQGLTRHPERVACVVGKPHVLKKIPASTPIIFGAAVHSHPLDAPTLLEDHNILGVLVPCEWVRLMFDRHWPGKTHVWPVGIETDTWVPAPGIAKDIDVLVYDKIRFHPQRDHEEVRDPIISALHRRGLRTTTIAYGHYKEEQFRDLLKRTRSMVFLCEHETQGIALLQTLSCDVPVYAWDMGGPWQDTSYYPHRVRFGPVTSVPYWDQRCGKKFRDFADFEHGFSDFWARANDGSFSPRSYVVENLTLEVCARHYVDLVGKLLSARCTHHAGPPPLAH